MSRRNKNTKSVGNGEGSLYKSEKLNCWIYQYHDNNGSRKTMKQKKSENVKDFKARVTALKNKLDNGTYIEKSNKTMINILEEHIEYKHNNNITSDRSYLRDKNTLEQIKKCCKDICNLPIQKVTVAQIKKIMPNITKYSENTISKIWRFINKTFKIALSDHLITFSPMNNISIVKPKPNKITTPIEALTVEEQKKFIDVLKTTEHEYNNILLLQLQTGMRIGEVLALTIDCIDLKNNQITVYRTLTRDTNDKVIMGKTAKTKAGIRTIPMNKKTNELCQKILDTKLKNIENLLFYDYKNNTYISPNEINCYLQRLNNKYKISKHIHTHMLRHSFATRFIEAGGSAKVLQKILGHKDIETTLNTYTSVFDEFTQNEQDKYNEYMRSLGM